MNSELDVTLNLVASRLDTLLARLETAVKTLESARRGDIQATEEMALDVDVPAEPPAGAWRCAECGVVRGASEGWQCPNCGKMAMTSRWWEEQEKQRLRLRALNFHPRRGASRQEQLTPRRGGLHLT